MVFKNFLKKFYIYILIFCLGLGLRIYALSTNPPLHIDETSTFAISTSANELDQGIPLKEQWNKYRFIFGKTYQSKDIQRAFFVGDRSFSGVVKDLAAMRNNNIDRQHPTLYYSIMRLWNLALSDFDPQRYVSHARNFNLILYIISFFFMFKLLKTIKNDRKFVSLGLFFAFVASGGIMLDTMAREYSLMMALFIVFTYLSFVIYRKIASNVKIKMSELIWYPVAASLFLLSGYYAVIYELMVFGILLLLSVCYRRWENLIRIVIAIQLTALYTIFFYPDYFDFSYNNEHYTTVKDNMFVWVNPHKIIEKLPMLAKHLKRYVFDGVVSSVILIFASLAFIIPSLRFNKKREFNKKELIEIFSLLFCVGCWAVAVNHTVVYLYYARYILPAIALYSLLPSIFAYRFNMIMVAVVVSLSVFFSFNQIRKHTIFDVDRIEYTDSKGKHIETYTKVPQYQPIVVVDPSYYPFEHFMFACVSQYFNVPVRFEHEMPGKDFIYKKYTLVCPKKAVQSPQPYFNIRGGRSVYLIDDTNPEKN